MLKNKGFISFLIVSIVIIGVFTGCTTQGSQIEEEEEFSGEESATDVSSTEEPSAEDTSMDNSFTKENLLNHPPHGVYYEIFIRAFADSDGDGIGDFKGATEKLDYLVDLGIEGIWLMPINPSPSYHGYDVTDYKDINEDYGTLEEFKVFVDEAHKRDINVILDFVVNHTSKQHPWFRKAMIGDEEYRDYYVWADEDTDIRTLGEWGQKVWHGSGSNRYEGVFWDGMPDLNFDNAEVRREMSEIGQFWLSEVGVDGFRLDAAKHIYSNYHSDKYEEKNHEWWREFSAALQEVKPDVFLVGEVWDSATVVAPYLDAGLTSAFNFDLSGKLISAAKSEGEAGIVSSLERTREYFNKTSQGSFIDSTFITNHDMNRTMSELNNNMDHAKMAASLLLTLPGNPFIYYGEEIGMQGQKPDEWIREPFIWGDEFQTEWERNKYNKETPSALEQLEDDHSLLNHYKNIIYVRRSHEALIKGEIRKTTIREQGFVIFERYLEDEAVLVVHNMTGAERELNVTEKYQDYKKIYFSSKKNTNLKGTVLVLPAYSTVILESK